MNEQHSAAIVFLLAAILCVLLFGSGAVLSAAGIFAVLAGIAIAVGLAALILWWIGQSIVPFLKGWIRWVGGPVMVPLKEWRLIQQRRSRGERTGVAWAIPDLLMVMWCLLVGSFFNVMAGLPVLLLVIWAREGFNQF